MYCLLSSRNETATPRHGMGLVLYLQTQREWGGKGSVSLGSSIPLGNGDYSWVTPGWVLILWPMPSPCLPPFLAKYVCPSLETFCSTEEEMCSLLLSLSLSLELYLVVPSHSISTHSWGTFSTSSNLSLSSHGFDLFLHCDSAHCPSAKLGQFSFKAGVLGQ